MANTFRLLSDEGLLGIMYDPKQREFSVVAAASKEASGEGVKVLDESPSREDPQDDSEPESEVCYEIYPQMEDLCAARTEEM